MNLKKILWPTDFSENAAKKRCPVSPLLSNNIMRKSTFFTCSRIIPL
jgi:hypothetical protein